MKILKKIGRIESTEQHEDPAKVRPSSTSACKGAVTATPEDTRPTKAVVASVSTLQPEMSALKFVGLNEEITSGLASKEQYFSKD